MKATKFIVTSEKNLKLKYGNDFSKIKTALNNLITSDSTKNIAASVVFIDSPASAKKAGIKVAPSTSQRDCKQAIDNLYKAKRPDYIVILGSQDIIPFQLLNNPAGDDGDVEVPSDLPYACDTPFSTDVYNFIGPTRVVGRIPDIPGVADVKYIERLINNVIRHKPIDADRYKKYFSVSAKVWQKSTRLSLNSMFGHNTDLLLSPVAAPKKGYLKNHFKPLTHFFNCHGASKDWFYYGQHGTSYPVALDTSNLVKNIGYGTVVAAECCFGAELVDPAITANGNGVNGHKLSIANNYLINDAIAFLGSSTIAYGPPDSQGLADLITQFFIKNILAGNSCGSALLNARQHFISESGPDLDPYELKTLAQFYLLGDPSIRPALPHEEQIGDVKTGNTTANDRKKMAAKGVALRQNNSPSKLVAKKSSLTMDKTVRKLMKEINLKKINQIMMFKINSTPAMKSMPGKKTVNKQTKFHTFMKKGKSSLKVNGKTVKIEANKVLVVKQEGKQILGWRYYVAK
jgi:hypothetical protein